MTLQTRSSFEVAMEILQELMHKWVVHVIILVPVADVWHRGLLTGLRESLTWISNYTQWFILDVIPHHDQCYNCKSRVAC